MICATYNNMYKIHKVILDLKKKPQAIKVYTVWFHLSKNLKQTKTMFSHSHLSSKTINKSKKKITEP